MSWQSTMARVQRAAVREFADDAPVVYTRRGSAPMEVRGICDDARLEAMIGEGILYEVTGPKVGLIENDIGGPPTINDEIVMRDQLYRIVDLYPDGQGMTVCLLEAK